MTQEDKDLLLKELCARLPYGVLCSYLIHTPNVALLTDISRVKTLVGFIFWDFIFEGNDEPVRIEWIKPYLRSLGVMTREENEEYLRIKQKGDESELIDFYLSHHLDYKHLMDKDLAIPAPDGMYGHNYPKYDSDDFAIEDRCWDDGNF